MTCVTTNLSEFLLARIAEEEATARAASDADGSRWSAGQDGDNVHEAESGGCIATGPWSGGIGPSAEHIARWDPARVLGFCTAARTIIASHDLIEHPTGPLYALAGIWSDHPDYDRTWRL